MAAGFNFVLSSNNSGNSSIETSNTLLSANNDAETTGSIALLTGSGNEVNGFDAFGGKDIFGSTNYSDMSAVYVANAGNAETAGSLACVGAGMASVSVFSDAGGASAGASVGGDCGGGGASCGGGGGFSSFC